MVNETCHSYKHHVPPFSLNDCRLNEDGMTPLDVALLLGDTPVARVLQHHGAVESVRCEY